MNNRVQFKIGDIEFEAEGNEEIIERERNVFLNTVLPIAVEAIMKTKNITEKSQFIASQDAPDYLPSNDLVEIESSSELSPSNDKVDLSRTSIASFINSKGSLNEQDFVLMAAYYDEEKNGNKSFTSDTVKQYYSMARRTKCSNPSDLLLKLAKKGYIMDDEDAESKTPKTYILTSDGIRYVEEYQPKEATDKPKSSKPHKVSPKPESHYSLLCADDILLDKYPDIRRLKNFKEQMIMVMYIVTAENKGDSFSVSDIRFLLTDILGLPATNDQIQGVFKHNKAWFKTEPDPNNKRANIKKLLQGAKSFAEEIIKNSR